MLYEDGHLRITQAVRPELLLVRGEIDITNSAAVAQVLAETRERFGRVLVDTSELTFVDVSGWRVLTALHVEPPDRRPQLTSIAPCLGRMSRLMTDLGP
ncbi:STAS domain-containing protein [Actinomadura alba]|uniref:STAS domain-containing protein n=1 Tax=Actinomadura alba TaxID=406431 RepID=A0ABR7M2B0_9ACTN|nr:STAS domain-containing protein [Actinomadura alba]MBC6471262.1 STAS domain-containing protein [Actinomadura alba]